MQSTIGGWLKSFFTFGFPLFPVADQSWLKEKLPDNQTEFVISLSVLFPLGQLHAIPKILEGEVLRRQHKLLVSRRIVKAMAAVASIHLLIDPDVAVVSATIGILFTIGIMGPHWIYFFRLRQFIRTKSIRVHPTTLFSWEFRAFNLSIFLLLFIYNLLRSVIDLVFEKNLATETSGIFNQTVDFSGGVISGILASPSSPGTGLLKAVGGFLVLVPAVALSGAAIEIIERSDVAAIAACLVAFGGGLGWGFWFFIRRER